MATLIFACPATGAKIETGVDTDQHTLSRLPRVNMRVHCERCGHEHQFPVDEGRLADAA